MGRHGKVRFSMFAKYGENVRYATLGLKKGKRERNTTWAFPWSFMLYEDIRILHCFCLPVF